MSHVCHNKSMSNLIWHANTCDPGATSSSSSIKAFAHGSTDHPAKHCMKIAFWVAQHHWPFAIVEDAELLNIFHDLNNQCTTPSWVTVSRDMKEIFKMSCTKVAGILQVSYSFVEFDFKLIIPEDLSGQTSCMCGWLDSTTSDCISRCYHSLDS